MIEAVDEMSMDEVLDAATARATAIRDAETDLLELAHQWAVLHHPDRLNPKQSALPGREKGKLFGGKGTPMVSDFAAATFGARIGRSSYAGAQLIADALDLQHRHPQLWTRVQAGEVRASYARHVVTKTRELEPEEAAFVDAGVAESADGRIPWSRFEALVEGKVAQAAPAAAAEKERKAATARFAKKTRSEAHGMASFLIRADIATINAIDAAITARADKLAEARPDDPLLKTDDDRRVHAVLALAIGADPDTDAQTEVSDLLPAVQLHIHCYGGREGEGIARVEGHGPVSEAWVRDLLGPRARFRIQPVLDLAGQAPVDAYEIPERHRQAVHLMTPADVFPWGSNTSRRKQIDHTEPWQPDGPPGQSRIGNYGPLTAFHHRLKTHANWDVKQPFPGIYLWRDPHGGHYLVDHTGSRRLPNTNAA
ncbi:hypothetical protein [Nocardioides ferulae]|uniref:hypothetical protein n=1 Tax=Nocardioides ferulae TaxID=2340821 RepID=UPI000F89BF98|nr:hypothetical protein [Nocardioides ferulae]